MLGTLEPESTPGAPPAADASALPKAAPPRSWRAKLSLNFERHGARTVIARRRHQGPLLVQRAFHERDGGCQVYLLHPPGGVVGGDQLTTELELGGGARALLTTPAATKLYRSAAATAILEQRFELAEGAALEWLPQETIAYPGSRARAHTWVSLAPTSHFSGWEVICLGRDASGFNDGHLVQRWSIERTGTLLWSERAVLDSQSPLLWARWGLAGRPVLGTFIATGATAALVDEMRETMTEVAGQLPGELRAQREDWCSVSRLGEVLVCRYLGYSAEAARALFCRCWGLVRARVCSRAVEAPRIWAT